MNHISFGSVLKEARLRKGLDLNSAAHSLKIRSDILQAIEDSDFANMPPSGYTRNMINAYARMLDVDSNEITRMYLDEVYAYRVGRAYNDMKQTRYQNRNTSRATSRISSAAEANDEVQNFKAKPAVGSVNSLGRRMYSSREEISRPPQNSSGSERRKQEPQLHRSRRSVIPEGKYGNMVSSTPVSHVKRSKTPFIIAGIAVIIVLFVVFGISRCSASQEETQNIPVTGIESSSFSESQSSQQQSVTLTAPSDFVFSYTVDEGSSSWIEVYIDDKRQEAGEVTGPASKEYTCSSKLRFVSGSTDGVSVSIDGEKQAIKASSRGVVNTTYNFDDILQAWYEEHPDAKRSNSSTAASSSSSSSSSSETSRSSSSNSSSSSSSAKTSSSFQRT